MSVKKNIEKSKNKVNCKARESALGYKKEDCCKKMWSCNDTYRVFLYTFIILILAYFLVLLATMIRNNLKEFNYIGQADKHERTITLDVLGKVTVKPDIAKTTMGVITEGKTVSDAQTTNTKVMNNLIGRIKSLGVEEKDIQSNNYNIYPRYDYLEDKGRVLKGYTVSQNVVIKIRDLEKVDDVISLAGEVGVNNVGGLSFTIDDMDVYLDEARADAMEKINEKMLALQKALGVRFKGIVSYNEYSENGLPRPMYEMRAMNFGIGGAVAPSIESGSTDITLNVNIIFEIE